MMAQPTCELVGGLDERDKGAIVEDERELSGRESSSYTRGVVWR
jgi:hypothetical protein